MNKSNLQHGYRWRTGVETTLVILGSAVIALNYYVLLQPNQILPPGLGGLLAFASRRFDLPFDVVYFAVNIPLFLVGFRVVGLRFLMLSLAGTVATSLFLRLFSEVPGIHGLVIGTLLGGLLNGAAIAVILMCRGSTGGMDIVCVVLSRRYPRFSIGQFSFFLNTFVILISGAFLGVTSMLATLIAIFLAGKGVDWVMHWGTRWRYAEKRRITGAMRG
ncbi:MAG TPA: YitT family protein [Paraburkholderia sp.]|uniref:YitT family protein n=1 Tax=Paraburkholderia sp. TaxID=1926495 RepID=UPI002BAF3898|nr:YitT family protein [Paraburkholderia sp.]HTR10495.1 YitT family protein [Paraburkholderia sp.]